MKKTIAQLLIFITTISYSQNKEEISINTPIYNKTQIGTQTWMTQNLNVAKFRNGDIIKEAKTYLEWKQNCKVGKPVWCYYKFNALNGNKYGKLYNWYAVNDSRGIEPEGWRIPSNLDFKELENTIQTESLSLVKDNEFNSPITAGFHLKSKNDWKKYQEQDGNGNDEYGFNALPGGYVCLSNISNKKGGYVEGIDFVGVGEEVYFWTNNTEDFNYHLSNGWYGSEISGTVYQSSEFCCLENLGFYIRCIKE